MEEVADVEMPFQKRLRVEVSDQGGTPGPSESMDDFDDIYGTPFKTEEEASGGLLLPASTKVYSPSTDSQKPVFLPNLPGLIGLGNSQKDAGSADGVVESQVQEICHTASQKNAPAIKVADEGTSKGELPEELESHEKWEKMVMEIGDETSGTGEQAVAAKDHGQTGREQESREKILSTMLDGPEDLADKPISELVEPASIEAATGEAVSFQAEEGESIKAPIEVVPPISSSQPAKDRIPAEDPLAFLEASLPPAPSREAGSAALKHEVKEDETEVETGPMIEVPTSEHPATANKHNPDAEFELDSSPLNSDSDTSDDSSSSSSEADDYEMLDPEEQARRLMAEDGGSDEEGGGGKSKPSGPLRTQNEKPDEDVPKPDVIVTEDMKIEELGSVEGTVENLVLIKANTSGEYQVLEQGSVLCLEDRTVIGVIAETLGRVQQPYYSVRFTNAAAISEAGIAKDKKVFYAEQYSTPVFTQPLKAFKGSDASNLHDEEVGDDELEFSDDEAEAEHKRRVKMQRQQKRMGRDGQSERFSRGPRGGRGGISRERGRGGISYMQNGFAGTTELQEPAPNPAEVGLKYDDAGNDMSVDAEDLYTPLARPTNLHEMMGPRAVPTENPRPQWGGDKGSRGRGRGRGNREGGRGFGRGRGQGHGGFGNRGTYRQPGGFQQPSPNGLPPWPSLQSNGFVAPATPQQNPYTTVIPNQQPVYPTFQAQYPHQNNQQQAFQHQQQQQQSSYTQPSLGQIPSPNSPSIPPGAHINPAFFRQPQQWALGNHQQM